MEWTEPVPLLVRCRDTSFVGFSAAVHTTPGPCNGSSQYDLSGYRDANCPTALLHSPAGRACASWQAVRYGHQIMVAHENDDFQVVEQWEPVTEVDVQTPREVYEELSGESLGPAPRWNATLVALPVIHHESLTES